MNCERVKYKSSLVGPELQINSSVDPPNRVSKNLSRVDKPVSETTITTNRSHPISYQLKKNRNLNSSILSRIRSILCQTPSFLRIIFQQETNFQREKNKFLKKAYHLSPMTFHAEPGLVLKMADITLQKKTYKRFF